MQSPLGGIRLGAQPGITPGETVPLSLGSAHVPSSAPSLDMDQGGLSSPGYKRIIGATGGVGRRYPGPFPYQLTSNWVCLAQG